MFEFAEAAVDAAIADGAVYSDARVVDLRSESIDVQNQEIEGVERSDSLGVGVRALIGSSWGFYATPDLSAASSAEAGRRAAEIARASASVPGPPLHPADVPVVTENYETPHEEDPFALSLSEKVDFLLGVTREASVEGVSIATAHLGFFETNKWFVSSQGSRIHQHLVESGGGFDATAVSESETQRRSFPQSFGQYETGGYETIRRWDYLANAARIGEEAVALLSAPELEGRGSARSSSKDLSSVFRSTSRSVTPSSSIASSGGKPRSPGRHTWSSRNSGLIVTAPR